MHSQSQTTFTPDQFVPAALDKILDKRLGSAYYDGLTGAARTRLEQQLASFTKQFDARYGTSLWEAMLRNGFPGG